MRNQLVVVVVAAGAMGSLVASADTKHHNPPADLTVTSTQFTDHGKLPMEMTCDGAEIQPRLAWSGAPKDTKSFAIEVLDLDTPAGKYPHWVVSGIQANLTAIDGVPTGAVAGPNGAGDNGWKGPCPPRGVTHHYQFTVFALDSKISDREFTATRLEDAMNGHIIGSGAIIGTYARPTQTP